MPKIRLSKNLLSQSFFTGSSSTFSAARIDIYVSSSCLQICFFFSPEFFNITFLRIRWLHYQFIPCYSLKTFFAWLPAQQAWFLDFLTSFWWQSTVSSRLFSLTRISQVKVITWPQRTSLSKKLLLLFFQGSAGKIYC